MGCAAKRPLTQQDFGSLTISVEDYQSQFAASIKSPLSICGLDRIPFQLGNSIACPAGNLGKLKAKRVILSESITALRNATEAGIIPTSMFYRYLGDHNIKSGHDSKNDRIAEYLHGDNGLIERAIIPFFDWLKREIRRSGQIDNDTKTKIITAIDGTNSASPFQIRDSTFAFRDYLSFCVNSHTEELTLERDISSISYFPPVTDTVCGHNLEDLVAWASGNAFMTFHDRLMMELDHRDYASLIVTNDREKLSAIYVVRSLLKAMENRYEITVDEIDGQSDFLMNLVNCPIVLRTHVEQFESLLAECHYEEIYRSTSTALASFVSEQIAEERTGNRFNMNSTENGQLICQQLITSHDDIERIVGSGLQYLASRADCNPSFSETIEDGLDSHSNLCLFHTDGDMFNQLNVFDGESNVLSGEIINDIFSEWQHENDQYAGNGGYEENGIGTAFPKKFVTEQQVLQSIKSEMHCGLVMALIDLLGFSKNSKG
ncbi:hypothetical protein [Reinekea sp. G2M2-21]|uniref:hypothetical protein n=1 Tax=Reinekea sp. G2M2-21 TaxID=2788942 RepID=UPI0018AC573E|nr:hypothetical protein [Reinekea sp. G2M2-21]